jgi:chromosome segregation ATPase
MTFEEMERTMQFILEQQAQLTAKQSVAGERAAESAERAARLEDAHAAAERQIERLGERMEYLAARTAERIEQLTADTDARIENLAANTARQIDHLGAALVELTEAHIRTEARIERLDTALVELTEAHIRTEAKIERLDAALVELTQAHARTENALARLAEAQANSDRKFDALIDFMRGLKDGGS